MGMLDINKMVAQEYADPTTRGHLIELEPWTEEMGIEMARQDGLELTDDHWPSSIICATATRTMAAQSTRVC